MLTTDIQSSSSQSERAASTIRWFGICEALVYDKQSYHDYGKVTSYHSSTEDTNPDDKMEFMREIDLMKNVGVHRNIVNMLACCVRADPPLLIMEYVAYGDLLKYLRQRRDRVSLLICREQNRKNSPVGALLSNNYIYLYVL